MEKQYGKLAVIKRVSPPPHLKDQASPYYLCKCECGDEPIIRKSSLINGRTHSCGKAGCRVFPDRPKKEKPPTTPRSLHGLSDTRFYRIWDGMKKRCYNKNHNSYRFYGKRGIKICDEWKNFENFMNDMYKSYLEFENLHGKDSPSLERIDGDDNYEKSNCKWITIQEQQKNKKGRSSVEVEVNGIMFNSLSELSKEYGIDYSVISQRHRAGKKGSDLVAPVKKGNVSVEVEGVMFNSLVELSEAYEMKYDLIKERYRNGKRGSDLVAPVRKSNKQNY